MAWDGKALWKDLSIDMDKISVCVGEGHCIQYTHSAHNSDEHLTGFTKVFHLKVVPIANDSMKK